MTVEFHYFYFICIFIIVFQMKRLFQKTFQLFLFYFCICNMFATRLQEYVIIEFETKSDMILEKHWLQLLNVLN